ncbi:MAG: preprotein translocase subunit YajC [Clostridia bacterium]|uniref:Protein translocase subunit yajC n=1 Tax=Peptococcus niger TaxID=2741 RepID=A0A1G6S3L1_PEPNI|nr:preprotein translocase subunit YajC [Peptococcus niger]MBS5594574.1 preprotein translocase subunit YajC [Clostridiales bacterium]MDU7504702.1 preprotein translocase subunit YajC [Clostridia bacterium]MDU2293471.1 preprotein translocase subunit YajC [Peptococcus niger]MDU7245442.1 preprotein translocase subunit YajC [Clostridiales bacterium]SDD10737.1 protein translocase subunit yajC [Peptococcus niger]
MDIFATNAAGGSITLIWLVAMFGLLYFFVMRPQKKQMKTRNEMLNNLSNGDHIVTVGGITGYIRALTEDYIYVEIAEGLTVEMTRQAVSAVLADDDAADDAELPEADLEEEAPEEDAVDTDQEKDA